MTKRNVLLSVLTMTDEFDSQIFDLIMSAGEDRVAELIFIPENKGLRPYVKAGCETAAKVMEEDKRKRTELIKEQLRNLR
jgi:hypothetical protein